MLSLLTVPLVTEEVYGSYSMLNIHRIHTSLCVRGFIWTLCQRMTVKWTMVAGFSLIVNYFGYTVNLHTIDFHDECVLGLNIYENNKHFNYCYWCQDSQWSVMENMSSKMSNLAKVSQTFNTNSTEVLFKFSFDKVYVLHRTTWIGCLVLVEVVFI